MRNCLYITSKFGKELSVHETSMALGEITLVFRPIGGINTLDVSNVFIIFCSLIVAI